MGQRASVEAGAVEVEHANVSRSPLVERSPLVGRASGAGLTGVPRYAAAASRLSVQRDCGCGCGGTCDESVATGAREVEPADSPLEAEADQAAREMVGEAPSDRPAAPTPPLEEPTGTPSGSPPEVSPAGPPTASSSESPTGTPSAGPPPAETSGQQPKASPDEQVPTVQASRSAGNGTPAVGTGLAAGIEAARSGGSALPAASRTFFESRLGLDLSTVRLHTGEEADGLSSSLQARAFSSGSDIFFRKGEYQPDTTAGRSLLAHELTHVAQQDGGNSQPTSLAQRVAALTPRWVGLCAVASSPVRRAPGRPGANITESGVVWVRYFAYVPQDYTTLEQAYRLFERVAYGKETNHTWKCGDWCDINRMRGRQVPFKVPRTKVPELNDPDLIKTRDEAKRQLAGQPPTKRKAIIDEVNRRYRKESGDPTGTQIGTGEEGKSLQWNRKLQEVLGDQQRLESQPPPIKDLLQGKKPMAPADYERLLKIAKKLEGLSAEDLAAFKWLTVRATDNLDLFEKAVDLFLSRKAQLVKAYQEQQKLPQAKDDLRAAFDKKWRGLDEGAIATMSEQDRYNLALRKRAELTQAQLKFMAEHPGATLKDFAKSATLLSTPETFEAIGKDLTEAAKGDANAWGRFAAGVGAGAKLSGWVLAVAGVLYVASWLTGVGELATIAAVAGYALAATITLSALESDLRVKAASQATTAAEFKRNIELAAQAATNVIVGVALIVVAAALYFIAKTYFPKTVAKMRTSLLNLRERIRLKGSIYDVKPQITSEMQAHRTEVVQACETAKQQAAAMAKEVAAMDLDKFAERLESGNGDFLDQTKARPGERLNYKELAKTPEGRAALDRFQKSVLESLNKDLPALIDKLKAEYTGKLDKFLADVEAAKNHEQLGQAADRFEPTLTDEHMKAVVAGEQDLLVRQKLADAAKALEQQAQQPPVATTPPPAGGATPPSAGGTTLPPLPKGPETPPPAPKPPAEQPKAPAEQPKTPGKAEEGKPAEGATPPASPEAAAAQVRIDKINVELAALRDLQAKLRPLVEAAEAAQRAFEKAELEIKRLGEAERKGAEVDRAKRAELERQRLDAIRARRQAKEKLQEFYEQNNLEGSLDAARDIANLEKDIQAIRDALNAKPGPVVDETKPLGGRYWDVEAQGGEVNHMPADAASPLSYNDGPGVRMDRLDHYKTNSWGSGKKAQAWRAQQQALIKQGKFLEALQMDIIDVRSQFGAKYEKGIQQMLDYVAKSAKIKALSKNSTVNVDQLRGTSSATK